MSIDATLSHRLGPQGKKTPRPDADIFVTLTVADQLCGIPVDSVRDILGPQTINRIPLAPPEVAGSLNLRGRVVTAIDLRQRLKLPRTNGFLASMAVVVQLGSELYAFLVDQVAEVMALPHSQFEANPPTLPPEWALFSNGIYQLPDRLLAVLDIARIITVTQEPR